MFVCNRMKEDIGPITYEGFSFLIPANSVSAIYTPAGEHFLTHNFRVENPKEPANIGVPPLLPADEKDWDGSTYAMVSRFMLNPTRLPDRKYLIHLAEKYGMDRARIAEYNSDGEITNETIATEINHLPVPSDIRIPERKKTKKE